MDLQAYLKSGSCSVSGSAQSITQLPSRTTSNLSPSRLVSFRNEFSYNMHFLMGLGLRLFADLCWVTIKVQGIFDQGTRAQKGGEQTNKQTRDQSLTENLAKNTSAGVRSRPISSIMEIFNIIRGFLAFHLNSLPGTKFAAQLYDGCPW